MRCSTKNTPHLVYNDISFPTAIFLTILEEESHLVLKITRYFASSVTSDSTK